MNRQIIFNNRFVDAATPVIIAANRGLRYGDGCFETMRLTDGKIVLSALHFERLFSSLDQLGFKTPPTFNAATLEKQAAELARKNGMVRFARVRLAVYRREGPPGGGSGEEPDVIIETESLDDAAMQFNNKGLRLGIFRDGRKAADLFSAIKRNSYYPYLQAARFAKAQGLDDVVVLNCSGNIADTSVANIFIVSSGIIKTPALSEGCIAGVMRRHMIDCCRKAGIPVEETVITAEMLENANEVFLTNAIRGLRWVAQIDQAGYSHQVSDMLYKRFVQELS
ncbi:MAG TPA: aminotransferase class IV [Chitinophagaceae bacterium]